MTDVDRGFREILFLEVKIYSADNGWILEIQKDKRLPLRDLDSVVQIAHSRSELNKLIEEIPVQILEILND